MKEIVEEFVVRLDFNAAHHFCTHSPYAAGRWVMQHGTRSSTTHGDRGFCFLNNARLSFASGDLVNIG